MGRFFKIIFIFLRLANSSFFLARNFFKSIVVFLVGFLVSGGFLSGIGSFVVSKLVFFSGNFIFRFWSLVFGSVFPGSSGFVSSGSARGGFLLKKVSMVCWLGGLGLFDFCFCGFWGFVLVGLVDLVQNPSGWGCLAWVVGGVVISLLVGFFQINFVCCNLNGFVSGVWVVVLVVLAELVGVVQESAGCGCLNGVVVLLVLAELVGLMHGFSDWGCLVGIVGGVGVCTSLLVGFFQVSFGCFNLNCFVSKVWVVVLVVLAELVGILGIGWGI